MSPAYKLIRAYRIQAHCAYRYQHAVGVCNSIRYLDALHRSIVLCEKLVQRFHNK